MNVKLEQLTAHLQNELQPVYVVSGDEHLLVQEACQQIRESARAKGFVEREIFTVEPNFNWDDFIASSNSLSLFSQQKLIELRLLTGKPGDAGSKALLRYLESPSDQNILLIITPKLDKNTQRSKWFKALEQAGVFIAIWPIGPEQLPQWIHQRLKASGLQANTEAIKLLAGLVDGNLLAAAQEIEKLQLLVDGTKLTAETIRQAVSDSSHFNVFNLVDTAVAGNTRKSLGILSRLKGEGVDPLPIAWALTREIRQLSQIAHNIDSGMSTQQAMQKYGVWKNRQRMVSSALARLTSNTLDELIRLSADIDQTVKGMFPDNPWDQLESVIMLLTGKPTSLQILE